MSFHAARRTKHKRTDRGERRENENKWQAGFKVSCAKHITCAHICVCVCVCVVESK